VWKPGQESIVNIFRHRTFLLLPALALAFLAPAVRAEQTSKAPRLSQDDRIKLLEERLDAAEKSASNAALEKDYITRTQKQYEAYYEKVLNTQIWTMGIMGFILTGVFVLVARFSLKMIDEHTKTATAGATVQMRNEYVRAVAKEVQKLWDSNAADIKKLKEGLTAQLTELEQKLEARSNFQADFVQALARSVNERHADAVAIFRDALNTYNSGKSRNLIETKIGATTLRSLFESLQKTHPENYVEKSREELADPLYNSLNEELAIAALQLTWLTPLINERRPTATEPPAPELAAATEPPARPVTQAHTQTHTPIPADSEMPLDEESDSCRLITT
jgi:multidrug efflux pump subunit AcrB